MKPTTVDAFVETRVLPEFRPVVQRIRQVMKRYAPEVTEMISYGIPAYRAGRIIAVISPTKKDITFSLSRGAEMQDKFRRLEGVGKVSKYVKFRKAAEVDPAMLHYYIKQALALDAQ